MGYCKHCDLEILDRTNTCPFCQNVLNHTKEEGVSYYPEIRIKVKAYQTILKILFIFSVLTCGFMIFLNGIYHKEILWCVFPIGIICYAWFAIRYCIFHNVNVGAKVMVQMIVAQVLLTLIDWKLGYSGWSLNYVFPGLILIADSAILILMIANFMNWQSYLVYQIQLLLLSFLPGIFYWKNLIEHPSLTLLAMGISLLLLVGTIIFGTTKAKDELIRRFHI